MEVPVASDSIRGLTPPARLPFPCEEICKNSFDGCVSLVILPHDSLVRRIATRTQGRPPAAKSPSRVSLVPGAGCPISGRRDSLSRVRTQPALWSGPEPARAGRGLISFDRSDLRTPFPPAATRKGTSRRRPPPGAECGEAEWEDHR